MLHALVNLDRYFPMRVINTGDSLKMYTRGGCNIIRPEQKTLLTLMGYFSLSSFLLPVAVLHILRHRYWCLCGMEQFGSSLGSYPRGRWFKSNSPQ